MERGYGEVENHVMADDKLIAEVADRAREAGVLGIDTEFMSEGRYRPLLCLVQLAVPNGDDSRVELIDPFNRPAAKPLAEVLADPDVEIVMHAARQDVAILRRTLATEVRGLFDTQLAAGFAGLSASLGYGALLDQLLGVKLKKGEGFTKWDRRPCPARGVAGTDSHGHMDQPNRRVSDHG
jgi:ribonuclease D